jgi:hypothetical protein
VYVTSLESNDVVEIDTTTNTVIGTIAAGGQPCGIVFAPLSNKLYVANTNTNSISVISTVSNTVSATISLNQYQPLAIAVNPRLNRVYVTNTNNDILAIDVATDSIVGTISMQGRIDYLTVSPINNSIYAALNLDIYGAGGIAFFDVVVAPDPTPTATPTPTPTETPTPTPTPTPTETPAPTPTPTETPAPTPTPTPTPSPTPFIHTVCGSTFVTGRNLATLNNCATDWAIARKISTELRIIPGGKNIAGLVLNYLPAHINSGSITYLVALIDVDADAFVLKRFNGSAFVTELSVGLTANNFAFDLSAWYTISLLPTITPGLSTVSIAGELSDIPRTKSVTFNTTIANYGIIAGTTGLFADRTIAYFSKISIE